MRLAASGASVAGLMALFPQQLAVTALAIGNVGKQGAASSRPLPGVARRPPGERSCRPEMTGKSFRRHPTFLTVIDSHSM